MKGKLFTILFTVLMVFSLSANAASYVSLAHVETDYNTDKPFDRLFTDQDTNGASLAIGWQTSYQPLSIEIEYTDFGNINTAYTETYSTYSLSENFNYDMDAITAWAVARYTLFNVASHDVRIIPRIGVSAMESRGSYAYKYTNDYFTMTQLITDDATGVGLAWGIGLEADIYKNVSAFIDYRERKADATIFNRNVTLDPHTWQAGLTYKF